MDGGHMKKWPLPPYNKKFEWEIKLALLLHLPSYHVCVT